MGRRRRRQNEHLPKHVYRKGAGFIYRRDGKDTYLCKQTAPLSELWAAYERVQAPSNEGTLEWLIRAYMETQHYRDRAPKTREAYQGYAEKLLTFRTAGGFQFGEAYLSDITFRTINGFLRKYSHPISANRQIQFLSAAWNQMRQTHDLPENPVPQATYNEQTERDRYVNDEEYITALDLATGYLPIFMELAYLMRARRGEIAALRPDDVLPEGVVLRRMKGSESEVTAMTPRLKRAIASCRAFNADAPTPIRGGYLIHDKHGASIKKNAFDSAWRRLMTKVEARDIPRFTFHDLKAKGITDQKDNYGGHRDTSGKMRKTYVRKMPLIQPPDFGEAPIYSMNGDTVDSA